MCTCLKRVPHSSFEVCNLCCKGIRDSYEGERIFERYEIANRTLIERYNMSTECLEIDYPG